MTHKIIATTDNALYYACRVCDAPIGLTAHSEAQALRLMRAGYCRHHYGARVALLRETRLTLRGRDARWNKKRRQIYKLGIKARAMRRTE